MHSNKNTSRAAETPTTRCKLISLTYSLYELDYLIESMQEGNRLTFNLVIFVLSIFNGCQIERSFIW